MGDHDDDDDDDDFASAGGGGGYVDDQADEAGGSDDDEPDEPDQPDDGGGGDDDDDVPNSQDLQAGDYGDRRAQAAEAAASPNEGRASLDGYGRGDGLMGGLTPNGSQTPSPLAGEDADALAAEEAR